MRLRIALRSQYERGLPVGLLSSHVVVGETIDHAALWGGIVLAACTFLILALQSRIAV